MTYRYRIEIWCRVQKQLNAVREDHEDYCNSRVRAVGEPTPPNSRQLQGRKGHILHIGDYRGRSTVDNNKHQEVLVAEVWHRQRGYR